MLILAIDTGTTDIRCRVWHHATVPVEAPVATRVRDAALTGSVKALKKGVSLATKEA